MNRPLQGAEIPAPDGGAVPPLRLNIGAGVADNPAVARILHDVLTAAIHGTDAYCGFLAVERERGALETIAALNISPPRIRNVVLRRARGTLRSTLREQRAAAGNTHGAELALAAGHLTDGITTLCLPLVGLRNPGVLCLLRRRHARALQVLDVEIAQALAERAALAIGADRHHRDLAYFARSLHHLCPQT